MQGWHTRIRRGESGFENGVALMYSGGCDSTLAACRLAERFPKVHLLTYLRFGFLETDNPDTHAGRMQQRFPEVAFEIHKLRYERVYEEIESHQKFRNLLKHGAMTSIPCGHCKLAMHLRNVVFCLDQGVKYAADGAVFGNEQFAEQNENILMQPLRDFYARFGITLLHPVHEQGLDTEAELFRLGITDAPQVKRTKKDKQVICSQHILFAMVMRKYLHRKTFEEYEDESRTYLGRKLDHARALVEELVEGGDASRLAWLVEKDGHAG